MITMRAQDKMEMSSKVCWPLSNRTFPRYTEQCCDKGPNRLRCHKTVFICQVFADDRHVVVKGYDMRDLCFGCRTRFLGS